MGWFKVSPPDPLDIILTLDIQCLGETESGFRICIQDSSNEPWHIIKHLLECNIQEIPPVWYYISYQSIRLLNPVFSTTESSNFVKSARWCCFKCLIRLVRPKDLSSIHVPQITNLLSSSDKLKNTFWNKIGTYRQFRLPASQAVHVQLTNM